MTKLRQDTLEPLADALTLYHMGISRYEEYASERAVEETRMIRKHTDELKKQGIPGVQAGQAGQAGVACPDHAGRRLEAGRGLARQ
jgi:hypothetical protein